MKTIILILILFIAASFLLYLNFIDLTSYLILSFLMLVFVWLKIKFFSNKEEEHLINKQLKNLFPDCKNKDYSNYIFNEYVKTIELINNGDDDTLLESLLSYDMFQEYVSRREKYKKSHHKNIMKNFELIDFDIRYIDSSSVNFLLKFRCYDYTLNRKNNLIRGFKNEKVTYEYDITFERKLNGNVVLSKENLISQG